MKKNILYMMLFALAIFTLTSCSDEESAGKSRITYYPTIELEGESYMVVDKGSTFVEPGYTSMLNGEDVTDKVIVSGSVDTSKSGVYSLTYTTTLNEDGFGASTKRTVVVLDPNSAIEGFWLTDPASYREYTSNVAFGRSFELLIIDNGDGTYSVDDLLGGWYRDRAGYGSNYALAGTIAIDDATGVISYVDSYLIGWGDSATDVTGQYDAATNHISWVCEYTDYPFFFHVELDKE